MADIEKSWIADIKKQIKDVDISTELNQWKKLSIYKVPAYIKDLNPNAYKPQVVSFGQYHYGDDQLKPMEMHKHRALLHFLKRLGKPLEEFICSLEEVVEELQDSYQSLEEKWKLDRDEFLKLMIIDGCFMLEILRIATRARSSDYALNDPIFSDHGMFCSVPYIRRDMLMIENQLPLLVLQKLVSTESGKAPDNYQINKLVLQFCAPETRPLRSGTGLRIHPLDLYRNSCILDPHHSIDRLQHRLQHRNPELCSSGIMRSAMELNEVGIRFKKSRTKYLHDIRFDHGVLHLPVIVVDDATEIIFLNLMAFERLHVGAGYDITSYVFFMDNIIDSAEDVRLLHAKGIIQNAIGSDKAVAKLFNGLSKDVTLDPDSNLDNVLAKVIDYCREDWKLIWNMWRVNLIHTYFRSPWAFLSLAAAIFLLALTVAQTVYSSLQYYQGQNSPSARSPVP